MILFYKGSAHYLGDKIEFDVLSEDPWTGIARKLNIYHLYIRSEGDSTKYYRSNNISRGRSPREIL